MVRSFSDSRVTDQLLKLRVKGSLTKRLVHTCFHVTVKNLTRGAIYVHLRCLYPVLPAGTRQYGNSKCVLNIEL